jgi:apolipoprotein N-acyltransferase
VPLARCANTGLTILVDSYGRVTGQVPVFAPAVLAGALSAPGPETLYTRLGDWPGFLCAAGLALLALRAVAGRRPGFRLQPASSRAET